MRLPNLHVSAHTGRYLSDTGISIIINNQMVCEDVRVAFLVMFSWHGRRLAYGWVRSGVQYMMTGKPIYHFIAGRWSRAMDRVRKRVARWLHDNRPWHGPFGCPYCTDEDRARHLEKAWAKRPRKPPLGPIPEEYSNEPS